MFLSGAVIYGWGAAGRGVEKQISSSAFSTMTLLSCLGGVFTIQSPLFLPPGHLGFPPIQKGGKGRTH